MKKHLTPLLFVILTITFSAFTNHNIPPLQKAEWLLGTWEMKTQRGSIFEYWVKTSQDEYQGKSFMLQGKDTVVFETIRLVQEDEKLYYIPKVKNQNNNQSVRFTATSITENKLVFENPEHDFPQVITYTKSDEGSLVAEISGVKNEQERKQTFPMTRVI